MDLREKGVLTTELGILAKEGIYFHAASPFAQENLCYPLWGATYTCAPPYRVERKESLACFLLFYIQKGEMIFHYKGREFTAPSGAAVLLDCKQPHGYHAAGEVSFHWFHYVGAAMQAYAERLWTMHGAVFPERFAAERYFLDILGQLRGGSPNEDLLSIRIFQILCLLSMPASAIEQSFSTPVELARTYMASHFSENLSIDDIANTAALSRYHFSRLFRKETGFAPYEYLMQLRFRHAKQLLSDTELSVEEIATQCGFCSATNLIRAFRQDTGMTPHQFKVTIRG